MDLELSECGRLSVVWIMKARVLGVAVLFLFYLQAVHLQRNGNTPRTPCPLPCGRCHPSLGLSPVTNEPTENKKLLISAALM